MSSMMNDLIRKGGRGARTGVMPDDESLLSGPATERGFTVQAPGSESPPEQFIYEPLEDVPGAWAVYPPGVPCDTAAHRISRADPAPAADFAKMQAALDDASMGSEPLEPLTEPLPEEETGVL